MYRILCYTILFALSSIHCHIAFTNPLQHPLAEIPSDLPWLTGPLISPSGHVVPPGHLNIEPYLFVTTVFGHYNAHWKAISIPHFYNINVEVPIQYGVINRVDVQIIPQFSWNHTDGASQWVINDLPLVIDIQLLFDKPEKWWPSIKVEMSANAPIGKYEKLNPKKLGTDAGGAGTWNETAAIVVAKLFQFAPTHFLATRYFCAYTVPNPIHVKNLNRYGGGKGTHGKVYPGNSLTTGAGLEYTLNINWVLACDLIYAHQNKTRFSGTTLAPMKAPSNEQWSLAPAFEYNLSAYVGIIAGTWLSFAGRNAIQFASGILAVNVYW